jgi:hypothetical protein
MDGQRMVRTVVEHRPVAGDVRLLDGPPRRNGPPVERRSVLLEATRLERKDVAQRPDAPIVVRRAEDAVRAVEVVDDLETSHRWRASRNDWQTPASGKEKKEALLCKRWSVPPKDQ